ncbi:hypothetical protein M0802_012293 [Mischocyttarus mexicanus]|nr:hypothetical protein M0802_012293 [Mischocyttarus mexicanus]
MNLLLGRILMGTNKHFDLVIEEVERVTWWKEETLEEYEGKVKEEDEKEEEEEEESKLSVSSFTFEPLSVYKVYKRIQNVMKGGKSKEVGGEDRRMTLHFASCLE